MSNICYNIKETEKGVYMSFKHFLRRIINLEEVVFELIGGNPKDKDPLSLRVKKLEEENIKLKKVVEKMEFELKKIRKI